jgi:hypothetical protein
MRVVASACVALALTACATPYGKYGLLGGFSDARIDENTFSISVDTNGFTSQMTTSMHAIYRAAELSLENGFDYFTIVGAENGSTAMAVAMPGAAATNTTIATTGTTAHARSTTTYSPTILAPAIFPNATLLVKAFKGAKPEGATNAYDARSVVTFLGPKIGASTATRP